MRLPEGLPRALENWSSHKTVLIVIYRSQGILVCRLDEYWFKTAIFDQIHPAQGQGCSNRHAVRRRPKLCSGSCGISSPPVWIGENRLGRMKLAGNRHF
jgi:hypothetical protein